MEQSGLRATAGVAQTDSILEIGIHEQLIVRQIHALKLDAYRPFWFQSTEIRWATCDSTLAALMQVLPLFARLDPLHCSHIGC